MPVEIDVPDDGIEITLREFISIVDEKHLDFEDQSSLVELAPHLRHLSNNKTFLIDHLFAELKTEADFQQANYYGPQVFMLHVSESYFMRANVWRPISRVESSIPGFIYDICHDHNFDILTVGYFGPGYRSRTYCYDASTTVGLLGEQVEMHADRAVLLGVGRVLLYRAKKDIHIQEPPDDMSISINVISRSSRLNSPQFQFDESRSCINRYLHISGSELVVRLAGLLGDLSAIESLEQIAATHPSSHMRALAAISRARLTKEPFEGRTTIEKYISALESRSYGSSLKLYDPDAHKELG